jgi:phosphoribosylcarboxyaminoimidazole (NCAIR) mutase
MGSDSDRGVMSDASQVLTDFGVPDEMNRRVEESQ